MAFYEDPTFDSNDPNNPNVIVFWEVPEDEDTPAGFYDGGWAIRKKDLIAGSGWFEAMLRGGFKEAESNTVYLHGNNEFAVGHWLRSGDVQAFFRQCPSYKGSGVTYAHSWDFAQSLYLLTDKYIMPALHQIVVDELLPKAWEREWSAPGNWFFGGWSYFVMGQYDWFKRVFNEYPRDLWHLYARAVLHFQPEKPDFDSFGKIREDSPEMAVYVIEEVKKLSVAQRTHYQEQDRRLKEKESRLEELIQRTKDLESRIEEQNLQIEQQGKKIEEQEKDNGALQKKNTDLEAKIAQASGILLGWTMSGNPVWDHSSAK